MTFFSCLPIYYMKMDLKNSQYKGSKSSMVLPFKLTKHWGRKLIAKWNSSDVTLFYCYEVTDYKNFSSILWKVLGKQGDEAAAVIQVWDKTFGSGEAKGSFEMEQE